MHRPEHAAQVGGPGCGACGLHLASGTQDAQLEAGVWGGGMCLACAACMHGEAYPEALTHPLATGICTSSSTTPAATNQIRFLTIHHTPCHPPTGPSPGSWQQTWRRAARQRRPQPPPPGCQRTALRRLPRSLRCRPSLARPAPQWSTTARWWRRGSRQARQGRRTTRRCVGGRVLGLCVVLGATRMHAHAVYSCCCR